VARLIAPSGTTVDACTREQALPRKIALPSLEEPTSSRKRKNLEGEKED